MRTMRRLACGTVAVLCAVAGGLPAWGAAGAEDPPGQAAAAAFHRFEIQAQSQAAAGYLFAVGDEENRLAGARVGVAKPADVYALAAAFQRGLAAGYTYAAVLGQSAGGGAGVAPEPPPGETRGLYPSEPRQSTWEGPVTAGAQGPVVDGRSEARATAEPGGVASLILQSVAVPGQLTVEGGSVASRGAPTAAGIEGESASVLSGITIGEPLRIDSLISRASALVPSDGGAPVGTGSTVVEGASVNGTPVRITEAGLEVADQAPAGPTKAQQAEQVRQALAAQNIEDVRLVEASAAADGDGVRVTAGALRVIYRNRTFGASNPQGFSGGGFEVGGATVSVTAQRVIPDAGPGTTAVAPTEPQTGEGAPPIPEASAAAQPAPETERPASGTDGPPSPDRPAVPAAFTFASTGVPSLSAAAPDTERSASGTADLAPPAPAATRLASATPAGLPGPDRDTARWTGAVFLVLGSVPLLFVLASRLARP